MNKHHKAESRKIKAFVRISKDCGQPQSYRRVRRMLRRWDRDMKRLPRLVGRAIHKGIKRTDYGVAKAVKQMSDGLRANVMLIDELEHKEEIPE